MGAIYEHSSIFLDGQTEMKLGFSQFQKYNSAGVKSLGVHLEIEDGVGGQREGREK